MSQCEIQPPKPSPAFEEVLQETEYLAECLEVELDRSLALQMLDWCTNKDITRIASWIDPALLGGFVKAVQRVASYVDVIREVLLGLGEYERITSSITTWTCCSEASSRTNRCI